MGLVFESRNGNVQENVTKPHAQTGQTRVAEDKRLQGNADATTSTRNLWEMNNFFRLDSPTKRSLVNL